MESIPHLDTILTLRLQYILPLSASPTGVRNLDHTHCSTINEVLETDEESGLEEPFDSVVWSVCPTSHACLYSLHENAIVVQPRHMYQRNIDFLYLDCTVVCRLEKALVCYVTLRVALMVCLCDGKTSERKGWYDTTMLQHCRYSRRRS